MAGDEARANQETDLQTILLVEDDEEVGNFLAQALKEGTPHAVLSVTNATQALEVVTSIKPSLFILDYQLPGIDGLELSDRLHSLPEFETVPTLLMSANLPPRRELQQRHIAALPKPFDLDDLLTAIDRLLPAQGE